MAKATETISFIKGLRQLSDAYLTKLLAKIEKGELSDKTTVTTGTVVTETHGAIINRRTKLGIMLPKQRNKISFQETEEITSVRQGARFSTPRKDKTEWFKQLEALPEGSRLVYIYPPSKISPMTERVIYTKTYVNIWSRQVFFVTQLQSVVLYDGIRADLSQLVGVPANTPQFHKEFNKAIELLRAAASIRLEAL